jgi:hypothetical protein
MNSKYVYQILWKPFTLPDTPVYLPHMVFLYRSTAEHVCELMNKALHDEAVGQGKYCVEDIQVNDK